MSCQERSTEPSQGPGKHDCTLTGLDCVSGDFCKLIRPPDAEVTADDAASTLFSNVCFNFLNILAPFTRIKITDVYGRSNISQHPPYYACSRHVPLSCALHRKFKCRIRLLNIIISVGGPMIDRFYVVFRVLFAFDVKLRNLSYSLFKAYSLTISTNTKK